eukprot:1247468-Pyramimonas_sp.AAC.1
MTRERWSSQFRPRHPCNLELRDVAREVVQRVSRGPGNFASDIITILSSEAPRTPWDGHGEPRRVPRGPQDGPRGP